MRFPTVTSPHLTPPHSVGRVMTQVILALIPATIAATWYFGWGVLINIGIAVTTALACEAVMLTLRRRPLPPALGDLSAVVAAWLFALTLPPLVPWWIAVIGIAFAMVFAKHLYGGLGYNPFNPAMVGFVVVLLSFPRELSLWTIPAVLAEQRLGFTDYLNAIFLGHLPAGLTWDALTSATPLDRVRTELGMNRTLDEIRENPFFGDFSGRGWEWVGNWYLLGGLWLAYRRVIDWRIPLAVLLSLCALAAAFHLFDPGRFASPAFHLFSGAAIVGAFFIATDPVTASTTPRGRLIYGAGIGVLIYVIRTWGGYAEGVAFAVLLMNMAAPTIDHYTRPRVFGTRRGERDAP
ncbi:MAG: electron transport complex subunit RsxD [Chromatiales bacterium]|jgi:electron transport complex protein RnfD|nr:electron transport complex subunit RsxD [Chromatiales bacterium]MDX9767840.1 electron transport complex subunit RsxD [Ectothiorhodospiraceae bacterium]